EQELAEKPAVRDRVGRYLTKRRKVEENRVILIAIFGPSVRHGQACLDGVTGGAAEVKPDLEFGIVARHGCPRPLARHRRSPPEPPIKPGPRLILRQNDDTVPADAQGAIEVKAVFPSGIGHSVEAVAVRELRIVHRATAIEPHDPLAPARKTDVE